MARTMATDKEEEVAEVFVKSQVLVNSLRETDFLIRDKHESKPKKIYCYVSHNTTFMFLTFFSIYFVFFFYFLSLWFKTLISSACISKLVEIAFFSTKKSQASVDALRTETKFYCQSLYRLLLLTHWEILFDVTTLEWTTHRNI